MDQKFNKSITKKLGEDEFCFQMIEIADKIILNVPINGMVDTTMELPLNSEQSINILSNISNYDDNEDSLGIDPIILIGDHNNFKSQIVASQVGKLILKTLQEPKSVIISFFAKWFGQGNESSNDDFDKLMFFLGNIKELISS